MIVARIVLVTDIFSGGYRNICADNGADNFALYLVVIALTDGSSNAKIANILEYGTSSQQAKPFLKPAKSAVKKQCVDAMKSAFEKEVEGL